MLVIVPPETAINQAAADLKRAADAFHDHIRIEALTSSPKLFEKGLAALGQDLPIHVSDIRDFSKIAQSLGAQDPSVLGICHLSQILTPEWFERARQCFETTEHIRALTGMAGETRDEQRDGFPALRQPADQTSHDPPVSRRQCFAALCAHAIDQQRLFADALRFGRAARRHDDRG